MGAHNKHMKFAKSIPFKGRRWRVYWRLNKIFLELGLSYEKSNKEPPPEK